jgi:hypothetical protein
MVSAAELSHVVLVAVSRRLAREDPAERPARVQPVDVAFAQGRIERRRQGHERELSGGCEGCLGSPGVALDVPVHLGAHGGKPGRGGAIQPPSTTLAFARSPGLARSSSARFV